MDVMAIFKFPPPEAYERLVNRLVAEGRRIGKVPFCVDGMAEGMAWLRMNGDGIPRFRQESYKEYVERRGRMTQTMWVTVPVELKVHGYFGAALPRTPEEIARMLEVRQPAHPPEGHIPLDVLAAQVAEDVGADEAWQPGWSTFKRSASGELYYEGRCIRGHLKDAALQVQGFFPTLKNFRAKFVNRVYVVDDVIPLGVSEIAGTEQRFIQVMTRQGPRSSIKYLDYICDPVLRFQLRVLNDHVILQAHVEAVLNYGALHGVGAERSQGWGRYEWSLAWPEAE